MIPLFSEDVLNWSRWPYKGIYNATNDLHFK